MSRQAEYRFIPTNPEDIIIWLTSVYEEIMGVTVKPASPDQLLIRWAAEVIVLERVLTNYAANQNIPSRAVGDNLDALAELFYMKERPQSKAATCKMRFSISEAQKSAVLIPAGTRITDASKALVWETREDNYVPIGETHIDVEHVTCQTAGTAGNGYKPGQINKLVDVYDYYTSCENITTSAGGSNAPNDDEYYQLMRSSMDAYSCAGARGSYIYWAKQVSTEIADVAAASPTPGVVKIYVLMRDGTLASEEIKGQVLAACSADDRRPLTDLVSVEDAEEVPYDIQLTYYVRQDSNRSGAELAAAVQAAVDEYVSWQCGKLGRDINPSKLISLLMQTGIKRVDVASPVVVHLRDGNQVLSADMSYDKSEAVPQVAVLRGTPTIINGGYENE